MWLKLYCRPLLKSNRAIWLGVRCVHESPQKKKIYLKILYLEILSTFESLETYPTLRAAVSPTSTCFFSHVPLRVLEPLRDVTLLQKFSTPNFPTFLVVACSLDIPEHMSSMWSRC